MKFVKTSVRIGAGAGYAGDRIEPAADLIERGALDYIVFECLAERTIALAQRTRRTAPDLGYDPMLAARLRRVLPLCRKTGARLVSNMGAANPQAAANRTREIAEELGLSGLRIAAVYGDDVLPIVESGEFDEAELLETGERLATLRGKIVSANAYIGCEPIVECLRENADVVIGGRIADPSLFLGPLVHEFGWQPDDWGALGAGILTGHLLECAGQLTGGYFADPPFRNVPDLARLGFPFADVQSDGTAEFRKLEGAGGLISLATCKEQLLYEIHDPARYLTPDVTADFSHVQLELRGSGCVRATGATGTARPDRLKVSVGYSDGYIGEGQISYAGSGAECRARLAIEVVRDQLASLGCAIREFRAETIGTRVRIAGRTDTAEEAAMIGAAVEALYTNGPAAGGGAVSSVRSVVAIASLLIPRELVRTETDYRVAKS